MKVASVFTLAFFYDWLLRDHFQLQFASRHCCGGKRLYLAVDTAVHADEGDTAVLDIVSMSRLVWHLVIDLSKDTVPTQ